MSSRWHFFGTSRLLAGTSCLLGALCLLVSPGCSAPTAEGGDGPFLTRSDAEAVEQIGDEAWDLYREGDLAAALDLLSGWEGSTRARSVSLEIAADLCIENAQPAMAVLYLDRAAEARPEDPALFLKKGEALLAAGKEEAAEIALRQCVSFDWNQDRAKILLAELLLSAGHEQKANAYLDAVDAAFDWDVRSLLLLGAARSSAGRNEEALRLFDEAHRISPRMVEPLFNRGRLLEDLGDRAGAVTAYRAALDRSAGHVPSLFNLGCLLIGSGEWTEGESFLERACTTESDPLLKNKMEKRRERLIKTRTTSGK